MRGFIEKLTIFTYFFLALFICSNSTFACENLAQNYPQQYFISSTKPENALLNNKKEEYYIISNGQKKSEITNRSNKNNGFGSGNIDNQNFNFNIKNIIIQGNILYPIRISHNISPNLKNAINTRAP